MRPTFKMIRKLICPWCEKGEFSIEHLIGSPRLSWGHWYCDECGHSIRGTMSEDGLSTEIEKTEHIKITTRDLLVLPPTKEPIWFVVNGMRFIDKLGEQPSDNKDYFYEEHSCPTNWFRPVGILADGDEDPHGFLQFVASKDLESLKETDSDFDDWRDEMSSWRPR